MIEWREANCGSGEVLQIVRLRHTWAPRHCWRRLKNRGEGVSLVFSSQYGDEEISL